MDEPNISNQTKSEIGVIRISKKYNFNQKLSQSIMTIKHGNKEIQYNLTHNINQRQIFETLKSIQNNSIFEHYDNQLIKTFYNNKRAQNFNNKKENKTFQKNRNNQQIKQLILNESYTEKKDIFPKGNIYNIKSTDIDKINIKCKELTFKKKMFRGIGIIGNKYNEQSITKRSFVNSEKDNIKKNKFDQINILMEQNHINNLSKKEMTNNNSQNIFNPNQVDNNNDKISGIINIKEDKNLFEKETRNNLIYKYSKNILNETKCFLCEKTCLMSNIFFAKCKIHYFCKLCLKLYYQNIIEKGIKRMKCPIFKCNYDIDNSILEQLLDETHKQILLGIANDKEQNKNEKIKSEFNDNKNLGEKSEKYELNQNKNIFEINSFGFLYNIKNMKRKYVQIAVSKVYFVKSIHILINA